ncbi:MAG: RND transporter [Gammaproteobacteria bacterium]|nr:MAG: RND transporter [Gammaproteobacteria bacterium]
MNISAYFIRHPLPGILLFILLSLAGWHGFQQMKIKLFPDIDLPIIVVTVAMPGGAPEQMENEIAKKIEDKLASLNKIKHIYSTLVDSSVKVTAEFALEKELQEALDDVRSAVNEVRGEFPGAAEAPVFTKMTINKQPLAIYSIASDNLDDVDLSWLVDNRLSKELLGISGVAAITRIGGVEREVQVLLRPEQMRHYQITVADISQQLSAMQKNFSGGEARLGGLKQPIRTIAAVNRLDDLQKFRLVLPGGGLLQLSDIADIRDAFKEQRSKALLDGKEGVAFVIHRNKGFGDLEIGRQVNKALAAFGRKHPHLHITEVFETISMVKQDYDGAMTMLAEGAALAVFIVLLFLGGVRPTLFFALALGAAYFIVTTITAKWAVYLAAAVVILPVIAFFRHFRATIVTAIALPLSVLPAFAGMYFLDISINLMVTLALSLVVGILVDDAIVEVENIDRHIGMGKSVYQAAIDAAAEIGTAVIAITTTLIAVFLPTAFMPGVPGKFFYQFGVAASLSIFSSLMVARIITPMLCAYFLVPHQRRFSDPLWMRAYLWFARWALRLRWLTMIVALGFFLLSIKVMSTLPKDFIPASDASYTQVKIALPPGGGLEKTEAVAENARKAIADIAHIDKIFSYIGKDEVRKATLYITFTERGTRPLKGEIENAIRRRLAAVSGAQLAVMSGGNSGKYEMILSGDNPKELVEATAAVINDLRSVKGLGNIANSAGLLRQELVIYPDYLKAAERGVSSAAIAQAIRIATVGDYDKQLAKFHTNQRQIPIVVRLPDTAKADINVLKNLYVTGTKGPVRIGDVARLDINSGLLEINRYDRKRFARLNIEIQSGQLGEVKQAINALPAVQSLPPSVKQVAVGDVEAMEELQESFAMAMGVAILCIYFVLILLFGQLLQPITILAALPLSIGGAVAGLLMVDAGMSLPAMIGLLMLMGIAVKNSILLVEYIIDIRNKHPDSNRLETIMDACHKRARPIIMTTTAMGAGMLPLILALGEADFSFRRPMAAAVFGGLITSTLLSLIVIPAFYTIVDDISKILTRRLRSVQKRSTGN